MFHELAMISNSKSLWAHGNDWDDNFYAHDDFNESTNDIYNVMNIISNKDCYKSLTMM